MAKRRSRGNGQGTLYQRQPGGAWRGAFYDHEGRRRDRSTGTNDRRAAERVLNKWVTAAVLRSEGVIDAGAEALALAGQRPIGEHLAEYKRWLAGKGNTDHHTTQAHRAASKLAKMAEAEKLTDLTPAKVQEALATLRRRGRALRTCNWYLQALRGFTRWATRDGRLSSDPLASVSTANAATDKRRERRPLVDDELARLLAETARGPVFRGMRGADRAMLYRLAAGTGLRASELRSLTPGSFDLAAEPPAVMVKAAYSKRRRDDRQPIRADLAERLRGWLTGRPRDAAVFATMPDRTAEAIRYDLRRARVLWRREAATWPERRERRASGFLRWRDDEGRVVDFHALRATYITALVKGGASVKVAQELARHSDPKLTMNVYTRLGVHDLAGALEALPGDDDRAEAKREPAAMGATGTDDVRADRQAGRRVETDRPASAVASAVASATGARNGAGACEAVRDDEADTGEGELQNPLVFTGESASMRSGAKRSGNSPGRIRTCDPSIMSRLL